MTELPKGKYYDGDYGILPLGLVAWNFSTVFFHRYNQGNIVLEGSATLIMVAFLFWIFCFNTKYYVLFEDEILVRVFYTKKILGSMKISHIYKEEIPYSWIYEAYYDKQIGSNVSSFGLVYRKKRKKEEDIS